MDLPLVKPCWDVPSDDEKNVDSRFVIIDLNIFAIVDNIDMGL